MAGRKKGKEYKPEFCDELSKLSQRKGGFKNNVISYFETSYWMIDKWRDEYPEFEEAYNLALRNKLLDLDRKLEEGRLDYKYWRAQYWMQAKERCEPSDKVQQTTHHRLSDANIRDFVNALDSK